MRYNQRAISLKTEFLTSRYSRLILLLMLSAFSNLSGQTAPRFIKTDIGNSGAKLYLPGKPDPVNVSYSPDSSMVFTIETIDSSTGGYQHFGCIMVNLKDVDLTGQEEEMLLSYLDYLKSTLNIKSSAGYGKGHTLTTHPSAKGVLDYWLDEEENHWVVKGWAAESTIFVLFIYGSEDYPNQSVVDLFFNGARFKNDK